MDNITRVINLLFTKNRYMIWLLAIIYIGVLDWMYETWLSVTFDYLYFIYIKPPLLINVFIHILAWLPALWMPTQFKRPSQLIYWFIYVIGYVPSILLPFYIGLTGLDKLILLAFSLFFGMMIIGSSYLIPLKQLRPIAIKPTFMWNLLYVISVLLTIYVMYVFKGNMRLVGFTDIYELRFAADDITKGSLVNYAIIGLGGCLYPIIIARGFIKKQMFPVICGFVGDLILYSTTGAKTNILSIIIIIGVYILVRKSNKYFSIKFMASVIALIIFVNIGALTATGIMQPVFFGLASIVFMRTICMEGMLTAQYYHFFENNPYTYYTHINVLSKVFHYPYGQEALGVVIGYYYTGDDKFDENATFWVTDGIAALGLTGVILISVICALVFWVLDCSALKHDLQFSGTCIALVCLSILNVSLFTTLLSGGLFAMIVLFNLLPPVTISRFKPILQINDK